MISIRNLHKSFAGHMVLNGASLQVERGETVVLLGPSGSGKTTLLRCVNGLERFDDGEVEVDGTVLEPGLSRTELRARLRSIRRRCGFVFQQFNLFPHWSVMDNLVTAPVVVKGQERSAAVGKARELLRLVGLESKELQRPSRLSGGEQQRIAIARALAMEPEYLLYDEPTSSLDPDRAREIWALMARLGAEGQTQLIVTHQAELVEHLKCRVVRMAAGVVACGGGVPAIAV